LGNAPHDSYRQVRHHTGNPHPARRTPARRPWGCAAPASAHVNNMMGMVPATWSRISDMGNGAVVSSHRSNNRAARLRTKVSRALFPTQKLRSPNSSSMPEDGSSQNTVRAGRQKTTLSIVVMLSGLSLRTRKLKYLSQTYEPNFMTNDPPHKLLSGRRK
jgi:hypothetical protein